MLVRQHIDLLRRVTLRQITLRHRRTHLKKTHIPLRPLAGFDHPIRKSPPSSLHLERSSSLISSSFAEVEQLVFHTPTSDAPRYQQPAGSYYPEADHSCRWAAPSQSSRKTNGRGALSAAEPGRPQRAPSRPSLLLDRVASSLNPALSSADFASTSTRSNRRPVRESASGSRPNTTPIGIRV